MARPRAFDTGSALAAAARVFRDRGYAGASLEELLKAMGLARQSLYGAFRDKRSLYLTALDAYNGADLSAVQARLDAGPTPFQALWAAMMAEAAAPDGSRPACLRGLAAAEFGTRDPEIAGRCAAAEADLAGRLAGAVRKAQGAGEVSPAVDAEAAGRFLASAISATRLRARAGAPEAELRDLAAFALDALRP